MIFEFKGEHRFAVKKEKVTGDTSPCHLGLVGEAGFEPTTPCL